MLLHPVVALGATVLAAVAARRRRAVIASFLVFGIAVVVCGFMNWRMLRYFALIGAD